MSDNIQDTINATKEAMKEIIILIMDNEKYSVIFSERPNQYNCIYKYVKVTNIENGDNIEFVSQSKNQFYGIKDGRSVAISDYVVYTDRATVSWSCGLYFENEITRKKVLNSMKNFKDEEKNNGFIFGFEWLMNLKIDPEIP
jgi:hypothetical protein